MKDDLLEQLGAEIRQREREVEVGELLEMAARGSERGPIEFELGLGSEELEALLAPPSEQTCARWLELAESQLGTEPSTERDSDGSPRVVPFESKPVPAARRRGAAISRYGIASLALAAGLVLWLSLPRFAQDPARLARYQAELLGATSRYRGSQEADAPPTAIDVTPGRPLTLLLRPAEPVGGDVSVLIWMIYGKTEKLIEPTVELSGSGTLRARFSLDELPPGAKLRIDVARPEAVRAPRPAGATTGPGWQRLELPLRSAPSQAP